jgi:hypothetical protein
MLMAGADSIPLVIEASTDFQSWTPVMTNYSFTDWDGGDRYRRTDPLANLLVQGGLV